MYSKPYTHYIAPATYCVRRHSRYIHMPFLLLPCSNSLLLCLKKRHCRRRTKYCKYIHLFCFQFLAYAIFIRAQEALDLIVSCFAQSAFLAKSKLEKRLSSLPPFVAHPSYAPKFPVSYCYSQTQPKKYFLTHLLNGLFSHLFQLLNTSNLMRSYASCLKKDTAHAENLCA